MSATRGIRRHLAGLAVVALAVATPALAACRAPRAPAPAPPPQAAAVWQLTYLKAIDGRVDDLARFLDANWFAMDRAARARGDLVDFQLLRAPAGTAEWDLLEIAVFADSAQHAASDSLWRTVYRPAHRPVLIDGRGLRELGRIVRSETLRRVAGAP